MADQEPALGAGDVPFQLDGKDMVLAPSVQACLRISRIGGGLNAAVQRCLALDMDTICEIITAGLNLNPTQAKMVPEAVYRTGLFNLSAPCIDFINIVGNGGQPLPEEEGSEQQPDPLRPASP